MHHSPFRLLLPVLLALGALSDGLSWGAEVIATKLDGTTVAGEIIRWSTSELKLTSPDGAAVIAPSDLLSLRFSKAPGDAVKRTAIVELVDGTVLPIESITTSDESAAVHVVGLPEPVNIPARNVRSIRFHAHDGELSAQWNEVLATDFASDVLVVLKREGKSLDYVEGVIGDLTDDKVGFELDNEALEVDRAKVAGILYFRDAVNRKDDAGSVCVIKGISGLAAHASQLSLTNETLELATPSGLKLQWPLDDIYLADFSAGKLKFLSDLEVASETRTPLVSLPDSVKWASEYGRVRRDQSAFGGKISVRYPPVEGEGAEGRVESFEKGLAIHSRTELTYRLPAGFSRCLAIAGIDPAASGGDVFLMIDGDGRRLLEIQIAGDQSPQKIDLDIRDVKRLTLVVDFGQNLDSGDWLNLGNARLVK